MTTNQPIKMLQIDQLPIEIYASNESMGHAAALEAQAIISSTIQEKGNANIILATGNSQLSFLKVLHELDGIDWSKVNVFHMDEFLGIDPNHKASFPRFLHKNFLDYVDVGKFFPVIGQRDVADQTCREYEGLLKEYPIDMVALGFGENGHIAFNDPPYAKFDDPVWVKIVELDEVSRKQQVGEGHFDSLAEAPTHAITLTIPALLASKRMLCIVPEARKADAVRACLREPVSEDRPGSILRQIDNAKLFLDTESATKI